MPCSRGGCCCWYRDCGMGGHWRAGDVTGTVAAVATARIVVPSGAVLAGRRSATERAERIDSPSSSQSPEDDVTEPPSSGAWPTANSSKAGVAQRFASGRLVHAPAGAEGATGGGGGKGGGGGAGGG